MAPRNYFTPEEITLCAYAAMYEAADFGGESKITRLTNRSPASIRMKIQNIAAMLDHAGIRRERVVSPLTGLRHGQVGRTTNWETVEPLARLGRKTFLERCHGILATTRPTV